MDARDRGADGAAPERTGNIPNGIDLARFAPLRAQRPETPPSALCLIGPVVPIKDIKTFSAPCAPSPASSPRPRRGSPGRPRRTPPTPRSARTSSRVSTCAIGSGFSASARSRNRCRKCFYGAVRAGGSLEYIEDMRDEMGYSIRQGLAEIAKIQTLAALITFVAGPSILELLGISALYLPLLHIQVIGAGLQVVLLSVLNVFFYLDQRRLIFIICAEFLLLNIVLTGVSLWLGAAFYGYGFTIAVLITLCTAPALLDRRLSRLAYETFMLQ